jgi:signal transduction histidine kinase
MLVHDLQGPLSNVTSSLELVSLELPEDSSEGVRLMLDVAVRSSQQLQDLVDSLMDISHLEAGYPIENREALDIGGLVNYVYAVEEPNLEQRGVELVSDIDPGLPAVYAEKGMLRRVLLNLLDNALKHSRSGQSVTIQARLEAAAGLVRFAVVDQGQGVPEAYRDLIFEKFQRVRTDATASGLGLGLAFCRLAIEALGGQIWVEDAPAGGACFCFTVPVAADEPSVAANSTLD